MVRFNSKGTRMSMMKMSLESGHWILDMAPLRLASDVGVAGQTAGTQVPQYRGGVG